MSRMSNLTDIVTGQKVVAVSGTPEHLIASSVTLAAGVPVTVKAKNSNTGLITLGNSSDDALSSGTGFFSLSPGAAISYQINDPYRIWIDATVGGEGVEYTYER